MKTLIPQNGRQVHLPRAKNPNLTLAALVLLACLLTACVPQKADSPEYADTPTPTIRPQTAVPTATLHPTVTADRAETSERTAQPTPVLPDALGLPTAGTPGAGEVPPDLLLALRNDLAKRLGIPVDQITVVHSYAVEWSDSSLGCPQPGMMYLQVITPGFRVILSSQDLRYDYHTDTKSQFILCNPDGVIADPLPLLPIRPGNKAHKCKFPPCK